MEHVIIENEKIGRVKIRLLLEQCPETCKAIKSALPLKLDLARWGDELYGSIPVKIPPENPREECEIGDVAYWLDGSGFCILFGKTPASTSDKPRLISPGNVFGKIEGDPMIFKQFSSFQGRLVKS
ncbi:MAG: cyclophilin-like fold protein [Promethearchaeota archaeon]